MAVETNARGITVACGRLHRSRAIPMRSYSTMKQADSFTQADDMPPLVVRPMRACAMLSIGLTRCYELMNAGELKSFKDGKSRKITVDSIKAYVDRRMGAPQ